MKHTKLALALGVLAASVGAQTLSPITASVNRKVARQDTVSVADSTQLSVSGRNILIVSDNMEEVVDSVEVDGIPVELLAELYRNPPMKEVSRTFVPDELLKGSMLPEGYNDVQIQIELPEDVSEEEVEQALTKLQDDIAAYAKKFLGTRYRWGAKGPRAFDCSGFTGYVFKNFGMNIGSNSRAQATQGKKIDIKEARVGDLMFFTRPGGGRSVGHVGMVIEVDPETGKLKFIHASSKKGVTITNYSDSAAYKRRFLQVRRVI